MGRQPVLKAVPYGSYSVVSIAQNAGGWPKEKAHLNEGIPRHAEEPQGSVDDHNSAPALCESAFVSAPGLSSRVDKVETLQRPWKLATIRTLDLYPRQNRYVDPVLATKEGFYNAHRHFMIGGTFVGKYRDTVLIVFNQAPDLLADAYQAVLDLLNRRQQGISGHGELTLSLGAKCLRSLVRMSSSIGSIEDAVAFIMLGQTLLVYNALIPCPSTRTITRGTLLGVKEWYPALLQEPSLDSVTLAPILVDTIESLIRRELPVVRLPSTDRVIVDRFLGVTSSLLPFLYDLCERSHCEKSSAQSALYEHRKAYQTNPYSDIESIISSWQPIIPPAFHSEYAESEVKLMLAQARLYRLTALLVIHRLRFPLGMEDEIGHRYAEAIFKELSPLKSWPADGATGLGLDFPIFVAMVECPDVGLEAFHAFDSLRFRKQHPTDILEFIKFLERKQGLGFRGSWLDLVNEGFHGDILP